MNDEAMNKAIEAWLVLVIRGLTGLIPLQVRFHQEGDVLFIQTIIPEPSEDNPDKQARMDIILEQTPSLILSIHSSPKQGDFGDEWPPQAAIDEYTKPKIIIPGKQQAASLIKDGNARLKA